MITKGLVKLATALVLIVAGSKVGDSGFKDCLKDCLRR